MNTVEQARKLAGNIYEFEIDEDVYVIAANYRCRVKHLRSLTRASEAELEIDDLFLFLNGERLPDNRAAFLLEKIHPLRLQEAIDAWREEEIREAQIAWATANGDIR